MRRRLNFVWRVWPLWPRALPGRTKPSCTVDPLFEYMGSGSSSSRDSSKRVIFGLKLARAVKESQALTRSMSSSSLLSSFPSSQSRLDSKHCLLFRDLHRRAITTVHYLCEAQSASVPVFKRYRVCTILLQLAG